MEKMEKIDGRKCRIEENGTTYVGNSYVMVSTKIIKDGTDERRFSLLDAKLTDIVNEGLADYERIEPRIYVGRDKNVVIGKEHTLSPELECLLDLPCSIKASRYGIVLSFWLDDELVATCATRQDAWKLPTQLQ